MPGFLYQGRTTGPETGTTGWRGGCVWRVADKERGSGNEDGRRDGGYGRETRVEFFTEEVPWKDLMVRHTLRERPRVSCLIRFSATSKQTKGVI